MKVHWSLNELVVRFPELAVWRPGFRCADRVDGRGKWIKQDAGGRKGQLADVALHADPGDSFDLWLRHSWPMEVSAAEAASLDDSLLKSVIESFWRQSRQVECSLVVDSVGYARGETTDLAVALAASLAVQDLLKKGGWWAEDPLPPVMARRA